MIGFICIWMASAISFSFSIYWVYLIRSTILDVHYCNNVNNSSASIFKLHISWNFDKIGFMDYAASELQMVLTTSWLTQQPGKTLQDQTALCNASTLCSTERDCKTSHSTSRSPQRQPSHCPHCHMFVAHDIKKETHSWQVTTMAESYCFQAKALSHISGSCLF